MGDNFKSAERPENKNTGGWIEYAVLKFWRDCLSRDEYIAEWADDEITTLRAQLAEAREIIKPFAAESEMWGSKTPDEDTPTIRGKDGKGDEATFTVGDLRAAAKFLEKVTTA